VPRPDGPVWWREERCDEHRRRSRRRASEGTFGAMGPGNPWSPNWRPDPTGRRLACDPYRAAWSAPRRDPPRRCDDVAGDRRSGSDGLPLIIPLTITMAAIPALALWAPDSRQPRQAHVWTRPWPASRSPSEHRSPLRSRA
jgi:hypothetical protein